MSVPVNAFLNAYWRGTPETLIFRAPGLYTEYLGPTTNVLARALWKTPVFDFRHDLLGSMGPYQTAQAVRGGQTFGGGITLAINPVFTPPTFAIPAVQINVYTMEYGHLSDPTLIRRINDIQDVTSDFFDPINDGTTAPYSPVLTAMGPQGLRYWRCALIIDILNQATQTPVSTFPVTVEATCW
jgi:hypothetical protein